VLGLLGVDANPGEMADAVGGRPAGLEISELAEVVAEAVGAGAIEPGPKRRLAHPDAAHPGQRLIVVRDPRDHVNMWVDVVHGGRTEFIPFEMIRISAARRTE